MQLSCPVVPRAVLGDPRVAFPCPVRLAALCVSTASGEEGEHTYPFSRIPLFLWCGCLLTAFSESAYYNLYGALEPVMPGPSLSVLVLVVLGGLSALLVLGQAHRSPIWYAFLLVIPVLVVGYTAWLCCTGNRPACRLAVCCSGIPC